MIKGIQMLWAFAVFDVFFIYYALFDIHVGGFGVNIFFIISGFVVAFVVQKSINGFFLKRRIRIVPLYIGAILLMVSLVVLKTGWFKGVSVTGEAIIKLLHNITHKIERREGILSLGWIWQHQFIHDGSLQIFDRHHIARTREYSIL